MKLCKNYRLDNGSSPIHDDTEDAEEQPLVRHRSRRISSRSMREVDLSPTQEDIVNNTVDNESDFPSEVFHWPFFYFLL